MRRMMDRFHFYSKSLRCSAFAGVAYTQLHHALTLHSLFDFIHHDKCIEKNTSMGSLSANVRRRLTVNDVPVSLLIMYLLLRVSVWPENYWIYI